MKNMRYKPQFVLYTDLIGMEIYARSKSNSTWREFQSLGECIDETKNTLLCYSQSQPKIYIKSQYLFQIWLPQDSGERILLEFDGSKIVGNPEQRIKLIRKKIRKKMH